MFKFDMSKLFQLRKALLKLGSTPTEDGTTLVYDNDVLEVEAEVFVEGEDGLIPAPDKDYVYDGKTITVEGGKVTAIVENEIEQPVEETEETTEETETVETPVEETPETEEPTEQPEETTEPETPAEEQPTEETETPAEEETTEEEEVIEEPSVDELKGIIEEQKNVIEDLKNQIEELKKKLEEPAAESAEDEFKNQKPTENGKIDFSKYIKKNKQNK